MADRTKRSKHVVDYKALNELSTADTYSPDSKRRYRPGAKFYDVERLISRRKEGNGYGYLVHWRGWSLLSSTWEPSSHLSDELISTYSKPLKPSQSDLDEAAQSFYLSVLSLLQSRAIKALHSTTFRMRHDIYRYVFRNKGLLSNDKKYQIYNIGDFGRLPLPQHWWYALDENGQGKAVDFPLKMKTVLGKSPKHFIFQDKKLVKASQVPLENVTLIINIKAYNNQAS